MQAEGFIENLFCRLCLSTINDIHFKVIKEAVRGALKVVLPNLNLEEGLKHRMCKSCCSNLFAAFNFKRTCMDTENIIYSYVNSSKMLVVELKEIYLNVHGNSQVININENQKICRLCLQLVSYGFSSLNEVDNDIIDKYIPQINISATKDPIICGPCFDSIHIHGSFLKNCLEAQKRYHSTDKHLYINTEDIKIKLEDGYDMEDCLEAQKIYHSTDKHPYIKTEDIKIKLEDGYDMEAKHKNTDEHPYIKPEEMEIKSEEGDQDNLDEETIENKEKQLSEEIQETQYECKTEVQVNKCEAAKPSLDVPSSKNRCFESEFQKYLDIHKDSSETEKYQCNTCNYVAKRTTHLKNHLLTHKDPSEIKTYKCDTCDYETKREGNLKHHMLKHKDPSETQKYMCDGCSYVTYSKKNLTRHMMKHRNPSEIRMYTCDTCNYETIYKSCLKTHLLTSHKDLSEVQMFKCDKCRYATIYEKHWKRHQLLKHKSLLQIRKYKCDICNYETRFKHYVERHRLTHKRTIILIP